MFEKEFYPDSLGRNIKNNPDLGLKKDDAVVDINDA